LIDAEIDRLLGGVLAMNGPGVDHDAVFTCALVVELAARLELRQDGWMTRHSRFEKLETSRTSSRTENATEPSDPSRFEAVSAEDAPTPAHQPAVDAGGAPPGPLETSSEAHGRFSPPSEDPLALETDELRELATLECGVCRTELGKFEVRCFRCGARLDSPESRAHNTERLALLREQKDAVAGAHRAQLLGLVNETIEVNEALLRSEQPPAASALGNLVRRAVALDTPRRRALAAVVTLSGLALLGHPILGVFVGAAIVSLRPLIRHLEARWRFPFEPPPDDRG
jgi:hypothetical protein